MENKKQKIKEIAKKYDIENKPAKAIFEGLKHIYNYVIEQNNLKTISLESDFKNYTTKLKTLEEIGGKSRFKETTLFYKAIKLDCFVKTKDAVFVKVVLEDRINKENFLFNLTEANTRNPLFEALGVIDATVKKQVFNFLISQKNNKKIEIIEQADVKPGWSSDFDHFLKAKTDAVEATANAFLEKTGTIEGFMDASKTILSMSEAARICTACAISGYLNRYFAVTLVPLYMLHGEAEAGKSSGMLFVENFLNTCETPPSASTTYAAVERAAYSRNDAFLCLDEVHNMLRKGEGRAMEQLFALANGGGRGVASGSHGVNRRSWKTAVILNGNTDLAERFNRDEQSEAFKTRILSFEIGRVFADAEQIEAFKNAEILIRANAGWGHDLITQYIIEHKETIKTRFLEIKNTILEISGRGTSRRADLYANLMVSNEIAGDIFGKECIQHSDYFLNTLKREVCDSRTPAQSALDILNLIWENEKEFISINKFLAVSASCSVDDDFKLSEDKQAENAKHHNARVKALLAALDGAEARKDFEVHTIADFKHFTIFDKTRLLRADELIAALKNTGALITDAGKLQKTIKVNGASKKVYKVDIQKLLNEVIEDDRKTNEEPEIDEDEDEEFIKALKDKSKAVKVGEYKDIIKEYEDLAPF